MKRRILNISQIKWMEMLAINKSKSKTKKEKKIVINEIFFFSREINLTDTQSTLDIVQWPILSFHSSWIIFSISLIGFFSLKTHFPLRKQNLVCNLQKLQLKEKEKLHEPFFLHFQYVLHDKPQPTHCSLIF